MRRVIIVGVLTLGLAAAGTSGCGEGGGVEDVLYPGQTDFTNHEPGNGEWGGRYGAEGDTNMSGGGAPGAKDGSAPPAAPPQGRVADVEEADIYKVDKNKLFYLNTYRGFLIYDLADPKKPKAISRLPVYGYPIEMFIQNNTVYALIRDALYLTQVKGKLQFKRHNVSQLISIDISDPSKPKLLQSVDIIGQLHEGVSRKVEDTIYVVSYISQYYYWDWNYYGGSSSNKQKEQAHVYSFNVADPKNLKLVDQLKVFEGGSYSESGWGGSTSRYFSGVTITATSNALMVAENWYQYGYFNGSPYKCGNSVSLQQAVVTVIDISDPKGGIGLFAKFETYGALGDQFKQTYVYDETTKQAHYYGIFARREWSSNNCSGSSLTQNTLEAWDITDGNKPKKVDSLPFGKPNETVRGSVFDSDRRTAYAITAQNVDPLYAISFADPTNLSITSEVDGLSGDMNVFRFIGDKKFLVAIGRDNSSACTGYGSATTGWSTNVAVSIIDVQDLSKIRLVQRKCVAVKNASWVSSELNWNLDQAHKMIGMHSDGKANVITVPVYYYKKNSSGDWWYSTYETAVGMMTWDLTKYDPQKSHLDQQVLENYGTIIHPKGQVKRSVVFTHKGTPDRRMVVNLSDTWISVVDVENLNAPVLQSMVEVASNHTALFRFGNYMVEHITPNDYYYGYGDQTPSEFRVRAVPKVGDLLEQSPEVANIVVAGVERAVPFKDNLILFRRVRVEKPGKNGYPYTTYDSEALVYSLADPTKPKQIGSVKLPGQVLPYYYYWCGFDGFWGGYWFDYGYYGSNSWTVTDSGMAFLNYNYDYYSGASTRRLLFLDLSSLTAPKAKEYALTSSSNWSFYGLVADPVDPKTFYLSYRTQLGKLSINGSTFYKFKYYAQPWTGSGSSWTAGTAINLPGRLIKTWKQGSTRLFMAHDYTYQKVTTQSYPSWQYTYRLNLLRQVKPWGQPLAELLDYEAFSNVYLKDVVIDGDKLFVNARPDYYYTQDKQLSWDEISDNLYIFSMKNLTLDKTYAAPIGTYQMRMMGVHKGQLFINLPGDGVLAVNVNNPYAPVGQQFMRTLGYASHIEFANDVAYVASGYFGIFQMSLLGSSTLPSI